MAGKSKILIIGDAAEAASVPGGPEHEPVAVNSMLRGLSMLSKDDFEGVYVSGAHLSEAVRAGRILHNQTILEELPDGVVVLDNENRILWANLRLQQWLGSQHLASQNFYQALGNPEILGPDFCPFHMALTKRKVAGSTLRTGDNRYFQIYASPLCDGDNDPTQLVVTVRDCTEEVLEQQKLIAIHKAGSELADLTAEELAQMLPAERIDLLKSNILHITQDVLHYDVFEIRMLDRITNELAPLCSVGIQPEAAGRKLYAEPQGNGVTGYVAATGESYLCDDTTYDPLYLEGTKGGRSSLTVPLVFHEEVIGTFNVESTTTNAFDESDLRFLEIFARDVAVALHTFDLLMAEKVSTMAKSVEAIHSAVALPVDVILNDAVMVMERYIGHEPEVVERLRRILHNARDIKQVIQQVGRSMSPTEALPLPPECDEHPLLRGRQVLVVDADESVRCAAHSLLERYGCVVETAHDGGEAIYMVRSGQYDSILSDIRLPDMSGYDLLCRLGESMEAVPMVLMAGFGYDPEHTLIKFRQAGYRDVLFKPFRLEQLLQTLEQRCRHNDELAAEAESS